MYLLSFMSDFTCDQIPQMIHVYLKYIPVLGFDPPTKSGIYRCMYIFYTPYIHTCIHMSIHAYMYTVHAWLCLHSVHDIYVYLYAYFTYNVSFLKCT